jgi:endonuclease/exonuclease/phosphatase family metal-dependent hydrolase
MTAGPDALRVTTLNVCGLPGPLRPLAERAAEFGHRLDRSDADVVNLQEVWDQRALAVIRAHLPSVPHLAWRRGLAGQPAGGLVTFSRRPIGAVSYRSFRSAAPSHGGLPFRARAAINTRLQGVLIAELSGLGVVVANTHLTANKDGDWSSANRYFAFQRAQLDILHASVPRGKLTILTGDFNIASDGPLYPRIVHDGVWRDPFAGTDLVTYHVEFLPDGSPGRRIDYVLVSGDETRHPVLDRTPLFTAPLARPDGRRMFVSDHVALTVRVGLRPPEGTG